MADHAIAALRRFAVVPGVAISDDADISNGSSFADTGPTSAPHNAAVAFSTKRYHPSPPQRPAVNLHSSLQTLDPFPSFDIDHYPGK